MENENVKTILKQLPPEDVYYDFEDYVCEGYGSNLIIHGNRDFLSFCADEKALQVARGEYYDDEVLEGEEYEIGQDYEVLDELKKVFGKEYHETTIRGYSQSDWQTVYYTDDVSKEALSEIEAFYFGKVQEFYDEEEGIGYIVTDDVVWEGKKAICENQGLDPETTEILTISGQHTVYDYAPIEKE